MYLQHIFNELVYTINISIIVYCFSEKNTKSRSLAYTWITIIDCKFYVIDSLS